MTHRSRFKYLLGVSTVLLIFSIMLVGRSSQSVLADYGSTNLQPLTTPLKYDQKIAHDVAFGDAEVADLLDGNRAEIALIMGTPTSFLNCSEIKCLQAEIYDYDANAIISVIVDVTNEAVLDTFYIPGAKPSNFNARLEEKATNQIVESQEVADALGYHPDKSEVLLMHSNHFESENCSGAHNCAAAVFLVDGGIVWVMYDGTTEQIDKIWWDSRPATIGSKDTYRRDPSAEFLSHVPQDCNTSINVNQLGWDLNYETTNSDGLEISDVSFNSALVMKSAKLVEWHADYGNWGYRDSIGCFNSGGSNGFPIYPYNGTQVNDIMDSSNNIVGFEVVQDFRMSNWGGSCNYRYEQHFQFYKDGSWRIVSGAFGQGCGNSRENEAIYRPVWRIDLDIDDSGNDVLEVWDTNPPLRTENTGVINAWHPINTEQWFLHTAPYTADNYKYRISDSVTGTAYSIEADLGQFGDGGTGDNAYFYVTQYHANEGAADMSLVPGGDCCNDDHVQGPQTYIDGESVNNENIVLWYVPQSTTLTSWQVNNGQATDEYCWTNNTSETWPCFSGPRFVPDNDPLAVDLGAGSADAQLSLNGLTLALIVTGIAITTAVVLQKRNRLS